MTCQPLALIQIAESHIGCPFRLHGRDPQRGLDCVGLVSVCLEAIGEHINLPDDYSLRNLSADRLIAGVVKHRLSATTLPYAPGDIVLLRVSSVQFHLGIIAHAGALIHAHAGLGRVVATPPPLPWPAEQGWRLGQTQA